MENAKTKVAGAAETALGTAQQYGKDGTEAVGKYADKAGDYLHTQASNAPAAAEKKKEEGGTGGVVGDCINKAKGLFKST